MLGLLLNTFAASPNYDGSWVRLTTPFTSGITRSVMAVNGNYIYHFGGINTAGTRTRVLWRYDTVSHEWTRLADAPYGRSGGAGAIMNNKLYVFGGVSETNVWASVTHCYDIATNTWSNMSATYPVSNTLNITARAIGSRIYLVGGVGLSTGTPITNLIAYNPTNDTYSTLTARPLAYANGAAFTVDGLNLITAMGQVSTNSTTNAVKTYNIAGNSWADAVPPTSPFNMMYMPGAAYNGAGYVYGGYDGIITYGIMGRYINNVWTELKFGATNPGARRDHSWVAGPDGLYLVGGSSGTSTSTYLFDVWKFVPK